MEVLDTLALALGFATLAGINLYMTTFVTGLAIRFDWLSLSQQYESLAVLGEWPVLTAAGILFAIEALADKIPWVDSTWDAFHTLIRPIGGGLLAIGVLGETAPQFDVVIALVFGSTTLVSHTVKSSTRLVINSTPEPVSNVVASVAEDVTVLGGLTLMAVDPKLAGSLCLIFLILSVWMMPKMWRRIRGFFWLLGNGMTSLVRRPEQDLLPQISANEDLAMEASLGLRPEVQWSVPVILGSTKGMEKQRPWTRGKLIATDEGLHLVTHRWNRWSCESLEVIGLDLAHEPRLLSQDIVLYNRDQAVRWTFRLPRGHREMARRLISAIRESQDRPNVTLGVPEPEKLLTGSTAA